MYEVLYVLLSLKCWIIPHLWVIYDFVVYPGFLRLSLFFSASINKIKLLDSRLILTIEIEKLSIISFFFLFSFPYPLYLNQYQNNSKLQYNCVVFVYTAAIYHWISVWWCVSVLLWYSVSLFQWGVMRATDEESVRVDSKKLLFASVYVVF